MLIARCLVTVIPSSLPVFLVLSKMRPDGVCRTCLGHKPGGVANQH
ncbi:hypothetical protein BSU04_24455 [Caballeronia sordidicola]|uniref:Uncharacterized protein n=1 Tax=Caballeronia sordidicola TaxID=196367 RepID=A0A226WXF5_CABSO|nr:hypothetical protein BSU04_24455 [Caballeronia sordidicola]